ncbi:MAG TPA: type II toxin-antitoxin system prevent-host-death family antitoxin [Tepidiformaceae bacterium]|nr:type II toxin-antitoxin system prevent-host-death family antitoxin [Tepidiformaceae bacterium]
MDTRTIPAGEFKAKCLALLDEVADSGEEIVVTKRGKPVARLAPLRSATRKKKYHRPSLAHMVEWIGDIESASSGDWEVLPPTDYAAQ